MNREQLKKKIRGTIGLCPTAFDNNFRVDYAKMADMTQWWVEQGLGTDNAPLKTSAALGEGPTLTDSEWPAILHTVVNAAGNDANVICGLKSKDTINTIEDVKRAQDLGATGVQIILPFYHHANQDDHVRHFTAISDAIDIGILIYNTHWFCLDASVESLRAETMLRLKDAERVVAVKWSHPEDHESMRKFSHIFNVIDNSGRNLSVWCHQHGAAGYISELTCVYPSHDLHVFQLMEQGNYDEAQKEITTVNDALAPWLEKTRAKSGGYRQWKALLEVLGRPMGNPRPPTLPCDENEKAEAKEIVKKLGWLN